MYSGNYGLPSHSGIVALARQRSLAYFWAGLLAEIVLVSNLTVGLKLEISQLTGASRAMMRITAALGMAGIGTLSIMFLLSWVGKLLH